MHNISLNDNGLNIKAIEQEVYKIVCGVGCEIMSGILERLDLELEAGRDVEKYRNKGLKPTHMHTVMGPVEYSRRTYNYKDEDGRNKYIRLLDEYLNNDIIGHVSSNMAEKIIERVMEEPYRKAGEAIASISNENLSHMTLWNVTQKVGERLARQQEEKIRTHDKGKLNGKREVPVLFQEADGLWLSMQGKDRPKSGKSRKREIKLAVSYEGWEKRAGQKEGYAVHNKKVCAGFCSSKDFKALWDATLAEEYNIDEIEMRILNGDGASWIKTGLGEDGAHFQLDPFHVAKAIVRNIPDKKEASQLNKLFRGGFVDEGFEYMSELLIRYNQDEKKMEKLEVLFNYLSSNYDGLKPYHLRGLEMPAPPAGMEYRHLGTMEHNICDVLKLRMKGRKMSWSTKGANYLAKLLAERASGSLYEKLDGLFQRSVSLGNLEEIIEPVMLSAAQANKESKTSKIYKVHKGSMPFEGQPLTEGMKIIRSLVKDRASSEFVYR